MRASHTLIAGLLAVCMATGVSVAGAEVAMADMAVPTTSSSSHDLQFERDALTGHAGFTPEELDSLTPTDIDALYRALLVKQQGYYDSKVGVSAIAKAVLRVWKALPAGIRHKIESYTTLNGFLNAIDHFTGTEEHIIYQACKYVGMNDFWANIVTKTITLFI